MTARGSVTGLLRCRPWFKALQIGKNVIVWLRAKWQWIICVGLYSLYRSGCPCQEWVVKIRPSQYVLLPEMHVPETGPAKVSLLGHLFAVVHAIVL